MAEEKLERVFLEFSARKLEQFTRRVGDCLQRLSYEQIWGRGSGNENAAGNLVLHLCGNVRQWIGAGVAGMPDVRERDEEFSARGGFQAQDLINRLESTVAEAAGVIRAVSAERLRERISVQGYEITVLEAIYHVVEHFAQHTGQIIFITKAATGRDLGYYAHLKNSPGKTGMIP